MVIGVDNKGECARVSVDCDEKPGGRHRGQVTIRLGSRVGSEPWYRYSASIEPRADHSMPNSMVASTNN